MSKKKSKNALSRQGVSITKASVVLMPSPVETEPDSVSERSHALTLSVQAELMRLGYAMDRPLFEAIAGLDSEQIVALHSEVLPICAGQVLADRVWQPMYPDFPKQVLDADAEELYFNALNHYWSMGLWSPDYQASPRMPHFEATEFRMLSAGDETDLFRVFTNLLASNASISDSDRTIVRWFVGTFGEDLQDHVPDEIPFKEQLGFFVSAALQAGHLELASSGLKTTTDVLRVYAGLSDADVSLAKPPKFRSLPRAQRRFLVAALEKVIRPDDLGRYPEVWKRAFHALHVGEFRKVAPRTCKLATAVRSNNLPSTFSSKVESAIAGRHADGVGELLSSRPGEFARRIDHLLRVFPGGRGDAIVDQFRNVAGEVDPRVLLQLRAHMKLRDQPVANRVVFPKGSTSKARVLRRELPALETRHVSGLEGSIATSLRDAFATRDTLGSVWIDPLLQRCPVPLSMRSASPGLVSCARGTRLPMTDKSTLRMFVWWIGQDVDLSCNLYSSDFKDLGHISYTQLKLSGINACHSGDITHAPGPDGAAEFIDIDIDRARSVGVRYVSMSALDFTGVTFAKMTDCYVGWMMRDKPQQNAIFDPKTVEQRIDLRTPTRLAMPVVFDLVRQEAVWMDLTGAVSSRHPNNVESNAATLVDLIRSGLSIVDARPTLHDLFELHAQARGDLITSREDADTVFAYKATRAESELDDKTVITPFDVETIMAEYL